MSDVEIKRATNTDLVVLVSTFGDEDHFADRLARQAHGRGILLTAWERDKPIGHAYLWLEMAEEPELREHLPGVPILNHVEVHPEHRNRRVGSELVRAAEKVLAEQGYERVLLAVRTDNADAYRLYQRLGYAQWEYPSVECRYEVKMPDGTRKNCTETCHVMVKVLRTGHA